MIKDKKIILVCKENSSFPMYFLGKELEKYNDVHYFFIHYTEVINPNNLNKNTYFYFKEKIESDHIHDVRDINLKFLKNRKKINLDEKRLKELEEKYTNFTSLNKQLISSQCTSTAYHDHIWLNPAKYDETLYWLLLNYDKCENVLETIKPDYIFDIDSGEIQRTIINEISFFKKIPYITIDHSRYKKFYLPCLSLGRNLDKYFVDCFKKNKKEKDLNKYFEDVKNYRKQSKIMSEIYHNKVTSSYRFNLLDALKFLIEKNFIFLKSLFNVFQNSHFKISFTEPMFTNIFKKIYFMYLFAIRKYFLYSNFNKHFSIPKNEKYVFMPLHKIPESSTCVKAPMYVNELSLIEAISKSIPINWKLYVKEHQNMIGIRKLEFYKKVNKLHNVKIVKSNFYNDPKPWIENSLCVVTISGTSGFEAAMLNKPAIVFGNVFYNVISGIKVAKSFEELCSFFKLINTNNKTNNNDIDCSAYIKTVEELGTSMDIAHFIELSGKKIETNSLNKNEEKELNHMINTMMVFYEKAVNYYHEQL